MENNVFYCPFLQEERQFLVQFLKKNGFKNLEKLMEEQMKLKPVVIRALTKNIMKNNGW
jgi:hypothetical protein